MLTVLQHFCQFDVYFQFTPRRMTKLCHNIFMKGECSQLATLPGLPSLKLRTYALFSNCSNCRCSILKSPLLIAFDEIESKNATEQWETHQFIIIAAWRSASQRYNNERGLINLDIGIRRRVIKFITTTFNESIS